MGKGLAQALLVTAREVFRTAAPELKITPPGFLNYLMNNTKPRVIEQAKDDGSGYVRDVKVRYRPRSIPGQSVTVDDCSIQSKPAYLEMTIPATSFRAIGLAFDDVEISKFERDALAQINVGTPQLTPIMKEIWETMLLALNGLFGDINNDLITVQAASFGKNQVTGSNATRTVNFPLNSTNNDLNTGMTMVMADAYANELNVDNTSIVGSGLVANYMLQQRAKGFNQAGLDTSRLILPNFYYDPAAQAAFGANQFALLEKDAVQFVNVTRFKGPFAGLRGGDYFFTIKFPVKDSLGNPLNDFEFDVQLTYRTCPGLVQIGTFNATTNPPTQLARGWNVIVMSSYQSVYIPSNAYQATDRLFGNNGTYRYTASNT
jgi:hypothetical protein